MPKILITGASGLVGDNLIKLLLPNKISLVAVSKQSEPLDPAGAASLQWVNADLSEKGIPTDLILEHKPDAVIHLAAQARPDICQKNPEQSKKINLEATVEFAKTCKRIGSTFLFTSTDLVFNGKKPPYQEDDEVSPLSIYGEHKAAAEKLVFDENPRSIICRLPLMFGLKRGSPAGWIESVLNAWKNKGQLRLFVDEYRSMISAHDAAKGIMTALRHFPQGIIHLGGREKWSRYEAGRLFIKVMSLSGIELVATHQSELSLMPPRPPDLEFDSNKAFSLGFNPENLETQIHHLQAGILKFFGSKPEAT